MKETLVSQFFVAGLIYSDYQTVKLKRGQRLSLVKQPDNRHDINAIQVWVGKVRIGFVPRTQTHEVRHFQGRVTRAVIHSYAQTNATHRMVLVNVYGVAAKPEETNRIC